MRKKKIMAMVFAAMMMVASLPIISSPQWSNCKAYRYFCNEVYLGVVMICWDNGPENGEEWQAMEAEWASILGCDGAR
jgi:hypothetical protein